MREPLRVLIIQRNRLLRESLAFVLSYQQNIHLIGSAADLREIIEVIHQMLPDIIIMDLSLPERDGLEEARQICQVAPTSKVLMIGLRELESDVLACIEAGVAGYVPQEASLEELLQNMQAIAAGEAFCSPKVTPLLFSRLAENARAWRCLQSLHRTRLTRRELEIISLIEEGLSNKEIAVRLRIELQTVKNHVHNVLEKLRVHSRREAAQYVKSQHLWSTTQ
jgi:two-component system nitrate/nitrite response regulator NarL